MKCTRSPNFIPTEHQPKTSLPEETESELTDNIRVFDVEAQGWRSFNFTTLKA
jgi:hypothetical protein